MSTVDLSNLVFPIYLDAPIEVKIDLETGELLVCGKQHLEGGGYVRAKARFSPVAARELLVRLKQAEPFLEASPEDQPKPDSVQ